MLRCEPESRTLLSAGDSRMQYPTQKSQVICLLAQELIWCRLGSQTSGYDGLIVSPMSHSLLRGG